MSTTILAIETATQACSAALSIDGEVLERYALAPRQHAALMLPMIESLLLEAGLSVEQLEEVAQSIENGPEAAGFASGVWTARMVTKFIRERFGVAYNWKYVPELLHKLGFSVQRPRKKLSRADHEAQEFWLRKTFPKLKKTPDASVP